MAINEHYDRMIPEYYPTMHMDGYTTEQIRHALHRKMLQDHQDRQEARDDEIPNLNITSVVKVK